MKYFIQRRELDMKLIMKDMIRTQNYLTAQNCVHAFIVNSYICISL